MKNEKHGENTYMEILKIIKKVQTSEHKLEDKVKYLADKNSLLHKAIDDMIITTQKHYKLPCQYSKIGGYLIKCKKPPLEISHHTFKPSCKHQWLHYGCLVCIAKGYNVK